MPKVLEKALEDLETKKKNYDEVSENYEQVAYYELLAAKERVAAIYREIQAGSIPA